MVAETQAMAHDAIGLIEVDYEILPAVIDEEAAIRDGAPQLHDNVPNNITTVYKMGGGAFPSPHGFIIKHPKSESEWSGIGLHVLATGQASASRPNTWGDYASVHA